MVSLFNGISAFVGYVMPKPSLLKNSSDIIELIARSKRPIHTCMNSKLTVIEQPEFELAYVEVQHFINFAPEKLITPVN